MYHIALEIDHAEARLEQEADEHACCHDEPLGFMLRAKEIADVELFVEHVLCAASPDRVVVDSELPRHVSFDTRPEDSPGDLGLSAWACRETDAGNDGIVGVRRAAS